MAALSIADYGIIGDCRTAALISRDGSIDWCCLQNFDSAAVFLRLLDAQKGGFFQITTREPCEASWEYEEETNVLVTTFETTRGAVRLTDFMPPWTQEQEPDAPSRILRLAEGLGGEVEMEVRVKPTFDYAREQARLSSLNRRLTAAGGSLNLFVDGLDRWSEPEPGVARADFALHAGERRWIVLTASATGGATVHSDAECESLLASCRDHWRVWIGRIAYAGPWRDLVVRSALALRLLTFEPTGALVAAPTTSLPEIIGGSANWDHRFTWLRDSGLILDVLQMLGHHSESQRFFDWIENLCLCGEKMLQPIYRVDGSRELPEQTLDHLAGHRGSQPVRIGNGAAHQDQLDIYGHVLDATWLCFERMPREMSPELWDILRRVTDLAVESWREPDHGIWEVRGEKQHFLYSKLFCWVAVDRAIRLALHRRLPGDTAAWEAARRKIRDVILAHGYDEKLGTFTQSLGSARLDATALVIPKVGFLPADDPRMLSTVERIRERLTVDGLVHRSERAANEDGQSEGAFAMCSFWFIENLAMQGRRDEASDLFERLACCANDLGLLSEEIDPSSGELLRNFPQGYTHLALIRAALTIESLHDSSGAPADDT